MDQENAFQRACKIIGSAAAVARALGVTKGAVSQWSVVPADRVIPVAQATGWRVTPHELRPDLYPNAGDGVPVDVDFSEGGEA